MPPNLVNFGPQTAENGWRVFAHPTKVCAQDELQAHICDTFQFNHIRQMAHMVDSTQMPKTWLALVKLCARWAHAELCHASSLHIYNTPI